jgi:hypothetical protein
MLLHILPNRTPILSLAGNLLSIYLSLYISLYIYITELPKTQMKSPMSQSQSPKNQSKNHSRQHRSASQKRIKINTDKSLKKAATREPRLVGSLRRTLSSEL